MATQKYLTKPILTLLSKSLNLILPGSFSSIEQISQKIEQDCLPIFKSIFERLLKVITFEGENTAFQIFGQSLTSLVLKTISFICVFLILLLIFKTIKKIIKISIKKPKINIKNKFFGAILGIFEGIIIFSLINFIFINLGEFLLNETILKFAQSGTFSKVVFEIFNKKIISSFI